MPELPEVETIRRGLDVRILRKKITAVTILCDKSWRNPQNYELVGREIVRTDRRGKALLFELDNNLWIMTHLRMTGQMVYVPAGEGGAIASEERFAAGHPDQNFIAQMPGKQTRIYITFADGSRLYFNDQRKFGFMAVMNPEKLAQDEFLRKLGPEPWQIKKDDFWTILQRHKNAPIKAVILNQQNIAGVGNIYADEGCFLAKVFPGRKAGDLSREEADALLNGLCEVMQRSIDSGGSTMKDYVRADGTKGSYLEKFAQVFRRDGEACRACGAKILKTRVAGRGTHYCPECQK